MTDGNGTHVTRREMNSELRSLRWELRAYALAIVLMVLLRFQVPQAAAVAAAHFFF